MTHSTFRLPAGRGLASPSPEFLHRISLLPEEERRLLQMRFEERYSIRQIAAIECQTLSSTHKRLRRLVRRLADPGVIQLANHPEAFDPRHWQIAIRSLMAGQSVRRICIEMNLPRRMVIAAVAAAKLWCDTHRASTMPCPAPRPLRQCSPSAKAESASLAA